MKIKKMLLMLGMVGFAGASSYAMAQDYVYRFPAYGAKASSNIGSEEGNIGGEETPESNLSKPSNFHFSENNDQLSGNVGDTGTVTIYDEVGNQVGQAIADGNGDFTSPIGSGLSSGDVLVVVVTNGAETISSNVTVPEVETDVACYDPANIGKVGTYQGCVGMLIVDRNLMNKFVEVGIARIGVDRNYYHAGSKRTFTFSDGPNRIFTGQVTDMSDLFLRAGNFDVDINYWDVSNVTNMSGMFQNASRFNRPLDNWDVSNVTNMKDMFRGAGAFNRPIGNWDVSNVTNMSGMFLSAHSFNKNLNNWDVSNVTDMSRMLSDAKSFNWPLNNWDVSNVTTMFEMFSTALNFNMRLNNWDTSRVVSMTRMFENARSFNQDLSGWCVSRISSEPQYFARSAPSWTLPKPVWGTCP